MSSRIHYKYSQSWNAALCNIRPTTKTTSKFDLPQNDPVLIPTYFASMVHNLLRPRTAHLVELSDRKNYEIHAVCFSVCIWLWQFNIYFCISDIKHWTRKNYYFIHIYQLTDAECMIIVDSLNRMSKQIAKKALSHIWKALPRRLTNV